MTTHLIIPDPHSHPDHSNERFSKLGQLVADLKPDHVICIGDWADMPSLCSYDYGTKGFEGRRYQHDVASAVDAQDKFFDPIRSRKKKLPKFWMLEGNHEQRISRAIENDAAKLDGTISHDDLQYKDRGWEYIRYAGATPGIVDIDGVAYAHYFVSGIQGRAVSGIHPAYQLVTKQYQSCTQGHSHTTDYCVRTNAAGRDIQGMVVGCYIDYFMPFAGVANDLWWRGVIIKRQVENGSYDPQWVSMKAIDEMYD